MQPGRDPGRLAAGELARERRDQRVAARAVDRAGAAQVAVELAALQEVGQRELLHDRRAEVVGGLGLDHAGGQPLGSDEPAQPQARRQRLADRPAVGDQLRREPLDRAHRGAVVAVLGVVVVLDDDSAGACGPVDQRGAALRREHHAERELVRRRDERGVRGERLEHVHAQPGVVHRHRHDLQPVRGQLLAAGRVRRVLHPDAAPAAGDQGAGEQRHPLRHAGGDDHALGVAGHAAGAAEVAGQRDPQLGSAARVAVVEPGVGRVAQGAPQRGEPGGAREQRDVGAAGAEVEAGRPVRRRAAAGRRRRGRRRRRRAWARPGGRRGSPRRRAARRRRPRRRARRPARARARARRAARVPARAGPSAPRRAAAPRAGRAAARRRDRGGRAGRVRTGPIQRHANWYFSSNQ